jgi:shikimate dehydrogenase
MSVPYAELIGDPVSHSKSPLIHKYWLEQLGMEGDYRAVRLTAKGLPDYLESRRRDPDWRGCNVTMPLKRVVLPLVRDPAGLTLNLGAMNILVAHEDGLFGSTTDVGGFFEPIAAPAAARLFLDRPVVVLGSGGAAWAAVLALATWTNRLVVKARDGAAARTVLRGTGAAGETDPFDAPLPGAALLVNATPLGMEGMPPLDLDLAPLPADATVYDMVYAPVETDLLRAARARGLRTVDGLEMLVAQAALSFEMFFDHPAPREHDEALRKLLTS